MAPMMNLCIARTWASAIALVGAKERGVSVRYQQDSRADLVLVDRVQIQQVLLNLIRNAIEAMEESERRELVLLAARSADDAVIVTVSDTGTGIREELRSELFQPFFTTKQHGMGLSAGMHLPVAIQNRIG